jgi:transcriptional regulator with XRE-family HTH domain
MADISIGAAKLSEFAREQKHPDTGKDGSIRNLARILEKDFPTVLRWVNGNRVPEYQSRKLLLDVCGIPMDDWDTPATLEPAEGAA